MSVKITIATVIWNPGDLLERTLQSVEQQDYPLVEHLIVDGRSVDETFTRLRQYEERNGQADVRHEIVVHSEPDDGLYDAMNKALRLATGDYILFLNAGDKLHSPSTLSEVVATIPAGAESKESLPAVIYGNTDIVDNDGNFLCPRRLQPPEVLTWKSFKQGMLVCHQAFFARTDLAKSTPYNLKYRFSADIDWCIRVMKAGHSYDLQLVNAKTVIADYLKEGMTTKNHRKSLIERFKVMSSHYGFLTTVWQHIYFVFRALKGKFTK